MIKNRKLRIVTVSVTAMVAASVATPAVGKPGVPSAGAAHTVADDVDNSPAVDAAAARLRALANDGSDRFGGLVVDPNANSVTVYIHGNNASDVAALARSIRTTGTAVVIKPAAYGLASLHVARQRIVSDPNFAAAGINSIMPATDGSGLLVGATNPSRARQLPAIAHSDVPVDVSQEGPPAALSRWKDTSPFWGGSAVKIPGGGHCSTAFGMHYTTQSLHVLLTAAHCSPPGWNAGQYQNGLGNYNIGPNYAFATNEDAMVINVSYWAPWTSGTGLYTAGVDHTGVGTGESFRTVTAALVNNNGDNVRTSGAYSGERSGITIANNDTWWWVNYPQDGVVRQVFGMLIKSSGSTVNVAGEGDSGGPVYSNTANNTAGARGLISAGRTGYETACTGYEPSSRTCFWQVYAPDINDIMVFMPIKLN